MKDGRPMKKTTLCYLEHNNHYLMMLRNKKEHDQSEGKWLGIGGKFLPGETPDECLAREVMEETGFALGTPHFHGVVHFVSDIWEDEDMYLYTCTDFSWSEEPDAVLGAPHHNPSHAGTIRESFAHNALEEEPPLPLCNEGELHWIHKDEVLRLNLWEGDHLFLERLIANEDFGEFTVVYEGDKLVGVR